MVKIHQQSSPDFLRELVAQQLFGDLPLFWLDAHWYDYWPLEDELRIITSNVGKAIILIDDFQIPNRPQFGYDVEQNEAEERICNFDFIAGSLNPVNRYSMMYPTYSRSTAFPWGRGALRGYPVIFVNYPDFAALAANDFTQTYFESVPVTLHSA